MSISLDRLSLSTAQGWADRLAHHLSLNASAGRALLAHLWGFESASALMEALTDAPLADRPLWQVLPPPGVARTWAKRTQAWLKAHGQPTSLSAVQHAWAKTWGHTTWAAAQAALRQAEHTRQDPWTRLSATDRKALEAVLLAPVSGDDVRMPVDFFAWETHDGGQVAHVAVRPATWDRWGLDTSVRTFFQDRLKASAWAGWPLHVEEHSPYAWPRPWAETTIDRGSHQATLVAYEAPDGTVMAQWMWDTFTALTAPGMTQRHAEPEEAQAWVRALMAADSETTYGSWRPGPVAQGSTLEEILAAGPHGGGHAMVLVYRGDEWWQGIWRASEDAPVDYYALADHHGGRVSRAKRQRRTNLDRLQGTIARQGDLHDLLPIARQAHDLGWREDPATDYEALAPVQALCAWWNRGAPPDLACADYARVYVWNPEGRIFDALDPDEPAWTIEGVLATKALPSYALFQAEGWPTVLVSFHRGRDHYTVNEENGWIQTYRVDGTPGYNIGGADPSEVDEAWSGWLSLLYLETALVEGATAMKTLPSTAFDG